jgi:hypothetical protein
MYQATAAEFMPLPIIDTRFAPKIKRKPFFCKIKRMNYFTQSSQLSPTTTICLVSGSIKA